MSGKDTRDLIADIYADSGADLDELTQLRNRIDEVQGQVVHQDGPDGLLVATSKSFDVTRLLVEDGLMKTRHRTPGAVDQTHLKSIVEANIAYLQAAVSTLSERTPPQ